MTETKENKMEYNIENILGGVFKEDEAENFNLKDKMSVISNLMDTYKGDIKKYVSTTNYDLPHLEEECHSLCKDSAALLEKMNVSVHCIENYAMKEVDTCLKEAEAVNYEHERMAFSLDVVGNVMMCGKQYMQFKEKRRLGHFAAAADHLVQLEKYINQPMEGSTVLSIYNSMKELAERHKAEFIETLNGKLREHFYWSTQDIPSHYRVNIYLDLPTTQEIDEVLCAMSKVGQLESIIEEFSVFLYAHVLEPLVVSDCTIEMTESEVTVTVPHESKKTPTYDEIITKTRDLIGFVSDRLYPINHNNKSVMDLVGNCVGAQYTTMLVEKCLINTIPDTMEELANYHLITRDIEEFQYFLMQSKFMSSDLSLLSYTDNLETLFAAKCCENLLVKARNIMCKDLSISMAIGVEAIPECEQLPKLDDCLEVMLDPLKRVIPHSLFYFPRCMISKSAQELLDLVNLVMEQAVECSDLLLSKLYRTCRLMFELYDAVMPYKHSYFLESIPQYVALFHNNCMYLAHNLQTLGEKWMYMMGERTVDFIISFADIVWKLRDMAYTQLTKMLQMQRRQILDNVRSSDLNSIMVKEVLGENAELAVRQCLRQLQLLKNVWISVLPLNVYTRLMGTLVNMFVEELIHRVCTVEDISVEMTTQLTDMYTLVVKKAPALFQKEEADINANVKSWTKFLELIIVLGASLKDIEKRWENRGPLALHFRPEELRNLIKALFQNTQYRANLLSKIK